MEEDSSSAKEDERSESSEYYRHRHSPCYILQQLIRDILKCLGVVESSSNSPQQNLPAARSSSSSQESTDDPADHNHHAPSSTSEPQMKTLEDGVVSISAFRRVPPRPPISSGGGSQHN